MVDESDVDVVPFSSAAGVRAVAYFRSSVEGDDGRSIIVQQDLVRRWAAANGLEIIREFCDVGPAKVSPDDRPALAEMVEYWISRRDDFDFVLCFDLSRLGRACDDSGDSLAVVCEENGKRIVVAGAA